jgi:hypothetical protein
MKAIKFLTMFVMSIFLGSIVSFASGVEPVTAIGTVMGLNVAAAGISTLTGFSVSGLAMSVVDISTLQESANRYDKDLKMLPVAVLKEELGKLGIALVPNVQNKDIRTYFERTGGIMAPYASGTLNNSDLGKAIEAILEVHDAYASVKDNVRNYKTTTIGPDQLLGKNTSKKHPWQRIMLWAIVSTFGEDLGDCLYGGTRNPSGTSPKDLFNGFDTLITTKVSSGDISAGKGNKYETGAITAPTDSSDTDAFDQLWELWANAHIALKNRNSIMQVPFDVYNAYQQAHFNKFKYAPRADEFQRYILEGTAGKCKIVPSPFLGTGDRVTLTVPGNFDFGMDSMKDHQFVQVRDPYEDPNYVQFWIQGSYGVRINSINQKVFCVNDGTPIHTSSFAGDYDSAAS